MDRLLVITATLLSVGTPLVTWYLVGEAAEHADETQAAFVREMCNDPDDEFPEISTRAPSTVIDISVRRAA